MKEQEIWRHLFNEQFPAANEKASSMWMRCQMNDLPRLEDVSIPHWKLQPIVGKSPEDIFWYRLSRGIFNVNLRLRTEDNLYYLEERDLFHDYFGHVPFLYDKDYTDYLIGLGNFYENSSKDEKVKRCLSNIYWFTSEFGLIYEDKGDPKVLGAGILSSVNELDHVYSNIANWREFNIWDVVMIKQYVTNGFQEQYFILRGKHQFKEIIKFLWKNL